MKSTAMPKERSFGREFFHFEQKRRFVFLMLKRNPMSFV
jgi:hypothetical protein